MGIDRREIIDGFFYFPLECYLLSNRLFVVVLYSWIATSLTANVVGSVFIWTTVGAYRE